jgi:hypothetical protein
VFCLRAPLCITAHVSEHENEHERLEGAALEATFERLRDTISTTRQQEQCLPSFFSNNERITTGRNINCVESCGPNGVALVPSSFFVYMCRIDLNDASRNRRRTFHSGTEKHHNISR